MPEARELDAQPFMDCLEAPHHERLLQFGLGAESNRRSDAAVVVVDDFLLGDGAPQDQRLGLIWVAEHPFEIRGTIGGVQLEMLLDMR